MVYHLVQPNKDSEPKVELFDPPGIFHVGQSGWPEGNCYQHHIEMNETPCTPLKEVERNDEVRKRKWKEICKQRKQAKKITKKELDRLDRWDKELEQFEKWLAKEGFC